MGIYDINLFVSNMITQVFNNFWNIQKECLYIAYIIILFIIRACKLIKINPF